MSLDRSVDIEKVPVWYLERVINQTMPGLQMYVRDVDMPRELADKYVPGTILREKAFTDATCRVGGLAKSHRISILSNHMVNFSDMADDKEVACWGLCVAQHDSHYKVLDRYEIGGKEQILLLHLPDDENWRLFENVVLSTEEELIEDCHERFRNKVNAEVIPELNIERWYDRLEYPLGFNDEYEPWELDDPIEQRLKPIGEMNFRDLVGKVVFIKDAPGQENPDYPDIVAYGYIDRTAGMSFHALCDARFESGVIETLDSYKDALLTIRSGGMDENLCAQLVDSTLSDYAERITMVEENYDQGEEIKETRKLRFLDPLRNPQYPDDIQAVLVTENEIEGYELVWVKLRRIEDGNVFAKLLNEPAQKAYGVHVGAILPLAFQETEDGIRVYAVADNVVKA